MIDILRDYGLILLIGQYPNGPLGGVALTLLLAISGMVLASPLAIVIGLLRVAGSAPLFWAGTAYVYLIRALPLLMLIFWAYFVVPLLIGQTVSAVVTVIVALVLYEAAFLGEIVRAGIQAIPHGQREAARSLGLGYLSTMGLVILPQALRNMLPSIVNQFSALIKNTALAYVIGVNELTYAGTSVSGHLLTQALEVYVIVAAMYFAICFALSQCVDLLERRLSRREAT